MIDIGNGLVLFGLILQLILFFVFIWIIYQISTNPLFLLKDVPSLRRVFIGLKVTVGFLLVRNLYRIIEHGSGSSGPVRIREWTFYVFEAGPIIYAFVGYCVFHFGMLLQSKSETPQWIEEFKLIQSQSKEASLDRDSGADC